MKKDRRLLYIITTLFVLSLLVIGTTSVIAQKQPNSDDVLKQAALKKSDFPKNVEDFTFSSDKVKIEDFSEENSFFTAPFRSEGFVDAYRVNGWYPLTLKDDASKDLSQGAFVENMVYLFENHEQATKAYQKQIEQYNSESKNLDKTKEDILYDNLRGEKVQAKYIREDIDFSVHLFIGLVDNRVVLLMVDGVSDSVVQSTFDDLTTTLTNHQFE